MGADRLPGKVRDVLVAWNRPSATCQSRHDGGAGTSLAESSHHSHLLFGSLAVAAQRTVAAAAISAPNAMLLRLDDELGRGMLEQIDEVVPVSLPGRV